MSFNTTNTSNTPNTTTLAAFQRPAPTRKNQKKTPKEIAIAKALSQQESAKRNNLAHKLITKEDLKTKLCEQLSLFKTIQTNFHIAERNLDKLVGVKNDLYTRKLELEFETLEIDELAKIKADIETNEHKIDKEIADLKSKIATYKESYEKAANESKKTENPMNNVIGRLGETRRRDDAPKGKKLQAYRKEIIAIWGEVRVFDYKLGKEFKIHTDKNAELPMLNEYIKLADIGVRRIQNFYKNPIKAEITRGMLQTITFGLITARGLSNTKIDVSDKEKKEAFSKFVGDSFDDFVTNLEKVRQLKTGINPRYESLGKIKDEEKYAVTIAYGDAAQVDRNKDAYTKERAEALAKEIELKTTIKNAWENAKKNFTSYLSKVVRIQETEKLGTGELVVEGYQTLEDRFLLKDLGIDEELKIQI